MGYSRSTWLHEQIIRVRLKIRPLKKEIEMNQKIVDEFPLTTGEVFKKYIKLPTDTTNVFYHYTTHEGVKGILRSGGLRATYRMKMNDKNEFDYARNVIYMSLEKIGKRKDFPNVAYSLIEYTRKNLDKFLSNSIELSRAYCACLTLNRDHPKQWELYAENGKGFAIGFNLHQFLNQQIPAVKNGKPFVFCAPVNYTESTQYDIVTNLVEAGIKDLQTFSYQHSKQAHKLTALRDRITKEIVVQLLTLIDFIKAPIYSSEREIRLILDSNDGTLKSRNIQYYERLNEKIPFVFIDFCNQKAVQIPLVEILIGPKASFDIEKPFLENLLDEISFNRQIQISQSGLLVNSE